ncbi:ABC transporter permease [Leucobacter sp. UCD-THU]|uniref:sugar ABC transporter permease n=1 Tax=Leucobacter sp. UCD-THU TaxID=1292023 RepID=UPI00036B1F25|nr:hypothetical protein [Leucobacter sp. UCD-THU]EYT56591.1 ABC transporter permease [Leucobacter sp. UCD-THU]
MLLGFVIIGVIFQSMSPTFLTSRNLANLGTEAAAVGIIALGMVFVLLVAQIDLSVGSMAGVSSAIIGVLIVQQGWSLGIAFLVVVATALLTGATYGFLYVRFRVASFVSSMAGLLVLAGIHLLLLKDGSINLPYDSLLVEASQDWYLPAWLSYGLVAVGVLVWTISTLARRHRRIAMGLKSISLVLAIVRAVIVLLVLELVVWYLNLSMGVSFQFTLLIVAILGANFFLVRTRWGRDLYAVGGNAEAARRAGINTSMVTMGAFMTCSVLAAIGGMMIAGRLASSSLTLGAGDLNLQAIAAAVIGGTSLFGGRGNALTALLGVMIITSISSGLNLLSLGAPIQNIVTGTVLVLAVVADAVANKSRERS